MAPPKVESAPLLANDYFSASSQQDKQFFLKKM
jgi:hypothetical protein